MRGAIKVKYGDTIEVFRGGGHGINSDGPHGSKVGEIAQVVLAEAKTMRQTGFRAAGPQNQRSAAVSSQKDVFAPRHADLKLEPGDHFRVKGEREMYRVVGSRNLDNVHGMTGLDFGYYSIQVEVVV
jgi:hypothetical protein